MPMSGRVDEAGLLQALRRTVCLTRASLLWMVPDWTLN